MPSFFERLSKARKRDRSETQANGPTPVASPQTTAPKDAARTYAVTVHRDQVALSRFVKRLSVSGAERIRVEGVRDDVVRIRMNRPPASTDWETTIARLIDRCGLHPTAE